MENLIEGLGKVVGNLPNVADSLVQSNGGVAAQPTKEELGEAIVPDPIIDTVKAQNEAVLKGCKDTLEQAIAFRQFDNEYGLPVEQLATYNAWRNGQLQVTDENAPSVISSLVSVASNGRIQDDYEGQLFASLTKMTDDNKHELKSGIDITVDVAGNAKRKFSREYVLGELKNHFDALTAGETGRRLMANQEILRRNAGLNEGEDFFKLDHERQMGIVKNLCPLYGDSDRFKTDFDALMKIVGDGYKDCSETEAGRYIESQLLNEANSGIVMQKDVVDDFLKSGQERTKENLAKWLAEHRKEQPWDAKNINPFSASEYADNALARASFDITQRTMLDDVIGVQDKDGKWHLQYKLGGKLDADFTLKNKVVSDIADADGRYNAIRAINALNENPVAWSFFQRWVSSMNGEVPEEYRRPTLTQEVTQGIMFGGQSGGLAALAGRKVLAPERGFLRGDNIGAFNMMMDYLDVGRGIGDDEFNARFKVCQSAIEAFSCVDRRTGDYWNGNDATGKTIAGVNNAIEGGFTDFWRGVMASPAKWFTDRGVLADYASKFTDEERAKAESVGRSLMDAMANANSNTFFNDDTVLGGAAEFLIGLEAMGPFFGASTKAVGGAMALVGKGARAAKLAKSGKAIESVGKWLVVGGKTEKQIAWANRLNRLNAEKVTLEAAGSAAGYTEKMTARIGELDKLIGEISSNPEQFIGFTDRLAQFISKIPASAYFYDEAKHRAVGTYVMSAEDVSDKTFELYEKHGEIEGVIEGLMMAGITSLARGDGSMVSRAIGSLRQDAKMLDRELEGIIAGTVVPHAKDATVGLGRKVALMRAFEAAKRSFAHNAEFVFTMEEGKAINDNWRLVSEEKMRDPSYKPTVYDWVGRGQADVLAETAKIASTSAISALVTGGAKSALQGVGAEGKRRIANSRLSALEGRISTDLKMSRKEADGYVANILTEYYRACKEGRREIRSKIRSELGEEKTRLFDQLVYELDTVRTLDNAKLGTVLKLRSEQKLDKDSVMKSLASVGAADAKVEAMPNGSVYITIPKGSKVGEFEFDADRKFVVKSGNVGELHSKKDGDKTVYDLNWIDEVITKHQNGESFGEFSEKLEAKLDSFETDGERDALIAKLKAGEDVDGLLALADKCAASDGIFIPKGDERFAKSMQGEDVDLVDGVILLANAKEASGTPMSGLNGIIDAAVRRGAEVETFLHEYFHAITECLPFTKEQLQVLNERFGVVRDADGKVIEQTNWKEGFVDEFLKHHTDSDAERRYQHMNNMLEGGVLDIISSAARKFCKGFGLNFDRKFNEDRFQEEAAEPTLNDFVDEVVNGVDADIRESEIREKSNETASEIVGGEFNVIPKSTRGIISAFRKDVLNNSGFGQGAAKEKHLRWVNEVARGWIDGSIDLFRYPSSVFGGFTKKDSLLCKSLCVSSLNGTNDSEYGSGLTSASSLVLRSNMTPTEARMFVAANGIGVRGNAGFDPTTCVIVNGGEGYVRLTPQAIASLHEYARGEQKKNIVRFARQNGVYFGSVEDYAKAKDIKLTELSKKDEEREGMESVVWRDTRHGNVVKHLARYEQNEGNDLSILLDRIALFNSIFPESRMNVTGWGEEMHTNPAKQDAKDRCFGVYVEQPYFEGSLKLTEKEVDAYMKARGFKAYYDAVDAKNVYVSKDNSVVVRDINEGNAIMLPDGSIRIIDAICALNTKQNAIDDIVPTGDTAKGFKAGTYEAVWNVRGEDTGILERIERDKKRIGATDTPITGKPFVGIGSVADDGGVVYRKDDKFVFDTEVSFANPYVAFDQKIDEKFVEQTKAEGYDGIIESGADGSFKFVKFDADLKSIGSCVKFDGKLVDVSKFYGNASWNVIGDRSLRGILGDDADAYSKLAREAFKEAFDAIGDEHFEATLKDRKRKIRNDEINDWLDSRKRNEITVDLGDGSAVPMKFYRGGADGRTRYEYAGSNAVIPRKFRKIVDGDGSETLHLADFYKGDELLSSPRLWEAMSSRVYVKGTQAYSIERLAREKGEAERVRNNPTSRKRPFDPEFHDGVGINEYGEVILEGIADNRTMAKRMNIAVVKAMQKYEKWEEPVTYSREYFGEVMAKRQQGGSPFVFDVNDSRLRSIVSDVVRERMLQVERGREIMSLGTDIEAAVERVNDAVLGVIGECAEYFGSEIEAKRLAERFGKPLDKLPKYTDFQREVIGGFVEAYNRNGLSSYDHTNAVLDFYRRVVPKIASKEMMESAVKFNRDIVKVVSDELANEIDVKIREMVTRSIREAVADMNLIEERIVTQENRIAAKEYNGRVKGEHSSAVVAEQSNIGEVERRMSLVGENSFTRAARMIAEDALATGGTKELAKPETLLKMLTSIREAMGNDAKMYSEGEIRDFARTAMANALESVKSSLALHHVRTRDGIVLDGGLKDENRRLKRENRKLMKRVENSVKSKARAVRVRNAVGLSAEEVDSLFGHRDTIGDLVKLGDANAALDPKAPILNHDKFSNDLTVDFICEFRDMHPEFKKMPISEFFQNPVAAAEFSATVASWLDRAARKCAYGRVRDAVRRDCHTLRWMVKPSFFTAKNILTEGVRKMVELQKRTRVNDIIERAKKTIDKKAMGEKAVVQNQEIYDRDVLPLVQEYWREVKRCMEMSKEKCDEEVIALQAKYNFGETEWDSIRGGKGSEGLQSLTEEQLRDRRKALIRATALTRYGGMKERSLGEVGDKVDELSRDITTHNDLMNGVVAKRIAEDKLDVDTLVDALTHARANMTGGGNIDISRKRSFWRSALYHNVPDLFLKMGMDFVEGSSARELCHRLRRSFSLAHIDQEQMISQANEQFVSTIRAIYGGRDFGEIITDLMTPVAEYAKFSRTDWGVDDAGPSFDVEIDGKKHTVKKARQGADKNATRSADGLSKAQLMYIYAACTQDDMRVNNFVYGRDAKYFQDIVKEIGPEGLAVVKWMRQQYDLQRKAMSPVCEALTGMPIVSPDANYFKLKFEQDRSDPLEKRTRFSPNLFPSFLKERTNHDRSRLEERVDIFRRFYDSIQDTAHYCAFMPIIDKVRTTFCDSRVQTAYAKTIGNEAYNEMYKQLATALNGGNYDSVKWLSALRNFTTANTLWYNLPSALKQFEGVGGWSAEMGVCHWLSDLAKFNFGSKVARENAASIEQVLTTRREEGYSDVARALKESIDLVESGKGKLRSVYEKYKKHGLTLTELIDNLASRSMAGAYFNQKFAFYRSLGKSVSEANQMALADVDYAIQTTQQSSRPEFQNAFQRGDAIGGDVGRVLAQFAGPSFVRLGMEIEAMHRYVMTKGDGMATREQMKEARKSLVSKVVALHFVCPTILTLLELFGGEVLKTRNPDDDDYAEECCKKWARNVLVGPFAGMFLLGSLIDGAAGIVLRQDHSVSFRNGIPMISKMNYLLNRTAKVADGIGYLMDDLDAEHLLGATLDVFSALFHPVKDARNTYMNLTD